MSILSYELHNSNGTCPQIDVIWAFVKLWLEFGLYADQNGITFGATIGVELKSNTDELP